MDGRHGRATSVGIIIIVILLLALVHLHLRLCFDELWRRGRSDRHIFGTGTDIDKRGGL
jgi:hypothetical protein